ncbi:flagellar biosynthesis protein FlhF [Thioalkalivibrio sp.]|uniref:flagellar biosynthesis protein FlhF n=1 Tax=Thioalkalivibrio sp. TaxID=2093813 RepID=UPI0035637C41
MKIRRFFAPDMRQAIRLVRDEQGPEAVILSSRRVESGVELVTAVDYDESAFSAAEPAGSHPLDSVCEPDPGRLPEPDAEPSPEGPADVSADVSAAGDVEMLEPLRVREAPPPAPRATLERPEREPARSESPTLAAMQREIEHLRSMLEGQLASLGWNDLRRREPGRARIIRRLERLGIEEGLARAVAADVSDTEAGDAAWREALDRLAGRIRVAPETSLEGEGIIALVGPNGVGKTTTVAKLAAREVRRHGAGSVALVTTDAYRIGAHRQLQTFGQILDVPVFLAQTGQELGDVLMGLGDKRRVFVDTAGMGQRDLRIAEELAGLAALPSLRSLLVVAATTQQQVLRETFRSFDCLRPAGAVVTRLDEAASLGPLLSALCAADLPLMYLSGGQRVPEDLQPARAARLVGRAVALASETPEERVPGDPRVLHNPDSDNHVSA